MLETTPTVAFFTLGCKVNQSDSGGMEQLFRQAGYRVVDFAEAADVYVINTCVVTNVAQQKSRQMIRRAARRNPGAVVAVAGCYPQTAAAEAKRIEGVSVLVGTEGRQEIVRLVENVRQSGYVEAVGTLSGRVFEDLFSGGPANRTRAYLKIQDGCDQYCSYCIIPYARGRARSRPLASVRGEAERLVAAGFREIVLIGIHLGAYGVEQAGGGKLSDAVKAVLAVEGLERLRLGSLESVELDDRLLSIMQEDSRICRHLHLPLQAGCDEVLAAMRRPYRTADFSRLVGRARASLPGVAITTDVIVGFPGETPELFAQTCAFVEELAFSKLHIFPFSPRQGTPAALLPGQVGQAEKHRRAKLLEELAARSRQGFMDGLSGQKRQVLFEQPSGADWMSGLTGEYVKAFVPLDRELLGKTAWVRLTGRTREDGLEGVVVD